MTYSTLTNERDILAFRNLAIARGINAEIIGLRMTRGRSCTAIARGMLVSAGLHAPRSKADVLAAFVEAFGVTV